jgi:hypothetical protein
MRSRSASEWVKAYYHIHQELTAKGFKPKLQILDNEESAALKHLFTSNDVECQLVPPHFHRHNAAERAIRTFKEHFVAGLSSVDPTFPLHLWDRLLPHADITLNLLRTSRLHPQLSAADHFHGLVDYNKTSFAPPGCKIIAHEKPATRRTWAPHGQHGYSLGPALHHYRCQNMYIAATASERIVDTLEFPPHNFTMPQLSSTYRLTMATNISNALTNRHPEVPFSQIGDDTITALTTLAKFFKNKLQKVQIPGLPTAPAKVTERTFPAESSNPILASPMPPWYQTRSQTTIHAQDITNAPLLPRVVTTMTSWPAPQGCQCAHKIFPPGTCPKTTFAAWTLPTWPSP